MTLVGWVWGYLGLRLLHVLFGFAINVVWFEMYFNVMVAKENEALGWKRLN